MLIESLSPLKIRRAFITDANSSKAINTFGALMTLQVANLNLAPILSMLSFQDSISQESLKYLSSISQESLVLIFSAYSPRFNEREPLQNSSELQTLKPVLTISDTSAIQVFNANAY